MHKISKRLETIANYVKNDAAVCDIGTDHGYLAIHLIENGIASHVIAADIGEKPLKNAEENIKKSGVSGIELRLCDGFSGIKPDEADTFVIAGMGGEVISGILERGADIAKNCEISLILQPTTSPEFLRRFLCDNGFEILEETPIFENSKIYSVMLVNFSGKPQKMCESFYYIGKVTSDSDAGRRYIEKQKYRCFECMRSLRAVKGKRRDYYHYKKVLEEIMNNFDF